MTEILKEESEIEPGYFDISPVWEYALDRETEGDFVRPILDLPVNDLGNRFVGSYVQFANGEKALAAISNVDVLDPFSTRHFIFLSIWHGNDWLDLARYHDVDWDTHGPEEFAKELGLPVEAVFPIRYDLRPYCVGELESLCGKIEAEPIERLTEDQLIKLAVWGNEPSRSGP